MSRPAQLEQQIERVKQIQAEMLDEGKPLDTPEPPTPVAPEESPPVQPVVQEPATISKEEYDRLEQRYRTLQGMHKADVTSLRGELNAATNAIRELENRALAAEKAAKSSSPPVTYVTAEDEEEYGETLDMVRRASREEAEKIFRKSEEAYLSRIAELEAEVSNVRNTVVPAVQDMTRNQVEQARADFWSAINRDVPNWRTINDNQAFKDWLLSEDPLTGSTRQYFLAQAQQDLNATRVIKFFKEWERTAAGGQTPAPTKSKDELEQFVAPGTSRSTGPVEQTKKQWTTADISQFYQDAMMGKYNSRPEEKKRIEADIFAAQREGRVNRS